MESQVEEIKNRLDIVDVIGEYLTLKPGGVNLKALCPFHQEKTPSFMVNRERQFWHCFGCNEGGDAFAFIQKIENMEFPEALKLLAAKAGVELKSYDPRAQSERTRLHDVHIKAAEFFHSLLFRPQGKDALGYLTQKRKLSQDTIRAWKLGYAPNEWRGLLGHLLSLKFTEKELIASGLALSSQGRTYDRFRNRVTFPIVSLHGQVVGFSARAMSADPNEPKYLNSPQTLIYDKGNTLFGLFQARGSIREKNAAILVEGNMDVIASSQSGVANVVAASGTGLTAGHLALLSRFTKELHMCFDADEAGLRAAERGITLALTADFFVKVIPLGKEQGNGGRRADVSLPPPTSPSRFDDESRRASLGGKDPGEIVEKNPEEWRVLAREAIPVMEYLLGRAAREHDLSDVQARKTVFTWLIGWLSKIQEPVERDYYTKKVSTLLDLGETIVRSALRSAASSQARPGEKDEPGKPGPLERPLLDQIAERALSLALQREDWFDYMMAQCPVEHLPGNLKPLYKLFISYYTIHKSLSDVHSVSAFLRQEHQDHEHAYLTLLTNGEEFLPRFETSESAFQELKTLIRRLRRLFLEDEKKRLAILIRSAEASGDTGNLGKLLEDFQAVSRALAKPDD